MIGLYRVNGPNGWIGDYRGADEATVVALARTEAALGADVVLNAELLAWVA